MPPLLTLTTTIAAIYFVFYLLRPIDFGKLLPKNPLQAAVLKVVVATSLGFLLATALVSLLNSALQLPGTLLKDF
ncbi:DUF1146 family protein [Fructobacillus americanaquae]|uniref:DUF1146 family protein n=1 Tax=Fructobacillus americanaquae TaxID=2940302 RepID=A0ABY5C312_9LACO|nr:DUF1146 family protein [Fructobacillus americanaquae]USS91705.1 DUF1146 family protein [Fructobacillus americanaquae]